MSFYAFLADVGSASVRERVARFAQSVPRGAKLLDAGAGQCQYKSLFAHCEYTSLDTGVGDPSWDYSHLDVLAPLEKMPFASDTFDFILCTEVLEHVSEPVPCVEEMFRVLKKGGTLFLTVPFFHIEHQIPHDYFRYTSYGLKLLCAKAGFDENAVRVEPIGGLFLRWSYEVTSVFELFPHLALKKRPNSLGDVLRWPLQLALLVFIRALQVLLLGFARLEPATPPSTAAFGWQMRAVKA